MDSERFWAKVERRGPDECWLWTGAPDGEGYGQFRHEGRLLKSHRVAFMLAKGPIPTLPGVLGRCGAFICHTCDVRLCCNPAHLFAGTSKDNTLDAKTKGRLATGERVGSAHLTVEQVQTIRAYQEAGLLASGMGKGWHKNKVSMRSLAREFGVDPSTVANVVNGKQWSHVTTASVDGVRLTGADRSAANRGSANNFSKLTEDQVRDIKRIAATEMAVGDRQGSRVGKVSCRSLAKQYGVSRHTISLIVNGKTWTHVET